MRDVAPTTLRRMLRLRQFSLFAEADLDELATIAENVTIAHIARGGVVAHAGRKLDAIHLILDGELRMDANGQTWGARHVFGALEVFAHRALNADVVAATELQTLRISSHEVGELLEDNFGILRATLRELAMRLVNAQYAASAKNMEKAPAHSLGLVERLIALRCLFPYSSARLQALAALAQSSEEVTWPERTEIVMADAQAVDSFVLLDGSVAIAQQNLHCTLEAGAQFGCLEGLAGTSYGATITALTPVRGLRTTTATLLDVIEDHTDMGVSMISAFAEALLVTSPTAN